MFMISLICLSAKGEDELGALELNFCFPREELEIARQNGYDLLKLKDCEFWDKAGEPQLPVSVASVVLPPGATLEKIEVTKVTQEQLEGHYYIIPAQGAIPLSESKQKVVEFTPPRAEIYEAEGFFPDRIFEVRGNGSVGGQEVVNLLIFPVQYSPLEGKVVLYSFIRLRVNYSGETKQMDEQKKTTHFLPMQALLRKRVLNPELIEPVTGKKWREKNKSLAASLLPASDYRYVIITSSLYESAFQPLADWKTKKGVSAKIVQVDWIQANYTGIDLAEKIRNFIKDAWTSWGTEYVLLGGDTDVVPDRTVFAMESGKGANRDDIRCDLYYADLDGSFNADGDGTFGEVEDEVDLYSDVLVGRVPVNTLSEVQTVVNKILTYEKNPPTDYLLKVLYVAEIEQNMPFSDSSVSADYIDEHFIPERFKPATKLYQRLGNENPTTVLAALNQGYHFINHTGHAWYNKMRVGGTGQYIYSSDMDNLSNGNKYGIIYSTGCWPAAIDQNCIAEHFINNPDGGGIAFIGNSRYGWFAPGNPLFGHSDRFNHWFYKSIFCDGIYRLGEVLAAGKMHFIPWSREDNIYRWHQYELNLLGDPELPVWTDNPNSLEVHHPEEITQGEMLFPVTVLSNCRPTSGALVCVRKSDQVYNYGWSDLTGQITFAIHPTTDGQLEVTVTAQNCLPFEDVALVNNTAKYITVSNTEIDDDLDGQSWGNGDGQVNPGERLEWGITLKNFSEQAVQGVSAVLEPLEPSLGNIGERVYGDLAPGAEVKRSFLVSVNANASNGEIYLFMLKITDEEQHQWNYPVGLAVARAYLCLDNLNIDDTLNGDGDGIPETGETIQLVLTLHNSGMGSVSNVTVSIISNHPCLEILEGTVHYGDFAPGERRIGAEPFMLRISPQCQESHFVTLPIHIHGEGYDRDDARLLLGIGDVGFNDDMEAGSAQWTFEGSNNLWHISTHKPHSGNSSWYCGHEGSFLYDKNTDCAIISPEITLPQNAVLSFWRCYELPIYGRNGLYIEMLVDEEWEELDFIGSGGALEGDILSDGLQSEWFQEVYDLSHYNPGTEIRIRFCFVSDDEPVEEGFYLDDIELKAQSTPFVTRARELWNFYE